MKKLLSLLSIITISGSAMPTIIAASPYQKQEKNILNNNDNEVNFLQKNNFEKLNRTKREIIRSYKENKGF